MARFWWKDIGKNKKNVKIKFCLPLERVNTKYKSFLFHSNRNKTNIKKIVNKKNYSKIVKLHFKFIFFFTYFLTITFFISLFFKSINIDVSTFKLIVVFFFIIIVKFFSLNIFFSYFVFFFSAMFYLLFFSHCSPNIATLLCNPSISSIY